jgi:hypothetical protein
MARTYNYIPDPRFETGPDGQTIDLWAKDKKFSELKDQLKERLKATPPGPTDLSKFCVAMNQYNLPSCFPAGTPVLMEDYTERSIEEIAPGNKVRTHTGRARKVTQKFDRLYTGLLYSINVQGWDYSLPLTDEHPVAVFPNTTTKRKMYEPGDLSWVSAKNLKPGDFVLLPARTGEVEDKPNQILDATKYFEDDIIVQDDRVRLTTSRLGMTIPAKIEVDENFARLVGLFLAEGSYMKHHGNREGIKFTFARHEKNYQEFVRTTLESVFSLRADILETEERPSVSDVACNSSTLARFFYGLCGEWALWKSLDPLFFAAPQRVQLALLKGWYQGDGKQDPVRTTKRVGGPVRCAASVEGVTSSAKLHRDLFRLSLLCGIKPSTKVRDQADHQNVPGRELNLYSKDILRIFPEASEPIEDAGIQMSGKTWYRRHELGFLCRIRSIEIADVEDLPVYNLEVEGDNTYVANSIAVHNCVGNGTCESLEILENIAHQATAGYQAILLSRMFVWAMARTQEGKLNQVTGCYVRTALNVISTLGVCTEVTWPYQGNLSTVSPSLLAQREALGHTIPASYRIDTMGQDRLNDVMTALQAQHPIVFGTNVTNAFEGLSGNGPVDVPGPTDSIAGGHCMVVVGWDGENFIVKNSWGTGWGAGGFWLMTPAYLTWDNTSDLWVPTLGPLF